VGGAKGVGCNVSWVAAEGGGLGGLILRPLKLALGTWNVTSLLGKEPELVHEPVLLRGVGLSSTLELPVVRGTEQVWAYLLPPGCVPLHWGLPQWTRW